MLKSYNVTHQKPISMAKSCLSTHQRTIFTTQIIFPRFSGPPQFRAKSLDGRRFALKAQVASAQPEDRQHVLPLRFHRDVGSGACREAGKREPLFEVSPGEVKVTFYIDDEGGVNRSGKEVDGGVNELRVTILELMRATPTISAQRIAAALGTTKRRVESNINAMKKAGLLERVGSDKTGHWEVRTSSNGIRSP